MDNFKLNLLYEYMFKFAPFVVKPSSFQLF